MMTKLRAVILVGVIVVLSLVVAFQPSKTSSASAADVVASVALTILPNSLAMDDSPKFVGSKKCKMCHIAQYKSWETIQHAKALEVLKPGMESEIKSKFGLDPAKDYSTDETCLVCHTVGFGKMGGYEVPDPKDKKAVKAAKSREGVGCESCHGAGEEYLKLHKEINKSKRKYKRDEMFAAGMVRIEEATCLACHNEKSPTVDPAGDKFNFQERLPDGVHDHKPLKMREEAAKKPNPGSDQ